MLVVIDNACTDGTAGVAREHGARVVSLAERRSYAAAMNAGLAAVGPADAVLLLNADCFLDPGFLAAAVPQLRRATASAASPASCCGSRARRRSRTRSTRRACGSTGGARTGSSATATRSRAHAERGEVFGADGACALYRGEVLTPAGRRSSTRTWRSGPPTSTSPGGCAASAGAASTSRPRPPATSAPTRPRQRRRTSEEHRRIQFRNRYLMMARNESARTLLANLPWILAYEVLALGHVLLRERFLARGYREAWRLARTVRAKRRYEAAASS